METASRPQLSSRHSGIVPESELEIEFARASGPGGQNVNKRATKVRVRWHVGKSAVFSDAQKMAIRSAVGARRTADDEIIVEAEAERSQSQNRDRAVERLQALVAAALAPRKKRVPTKVSRGEKRKRLEEKRIVARKKADRRSPVKEW